MDKTTAETPDAVETRSGVSRRTAIRGGAWALPAIALATTAPVAAATPTCDPAPDLGDLVGDARTNSEYTGATGPVNNVLTGATLSGDAMTTIAAWESANAPLTFLPAVTTTNWTIEGWVQARWSGGPYWTTLASQAITFSGVVVTIDAAGNATFTLPQPELDDFFDALRAAAAAEQALQEADGYTFWDHSYFYNPGYQYSPVAENDGTVDFSYSNGCDLSQVTITWQGA